MKTFFNFNKRGHSRYSCCFKKLKRSVSRVQMAWMICSSGRDLPLSVLHTYRVKCGSLTFCCDIPLFHIAFYWRCSKSSCNHFGMQREKIVMKNPSVVGCELGLPAFKSVLRMSQVSSDHKPHVWRVSRQLKIPYDVGTAATAATSSAYPRDGRPYQRKPGNGRWLILASFSSRTLTYYPSGPLKASDPYLWYPTFYRPCQKWF